MYCFPQMHFGVFVYPIHLLLCCLATCTSLCFVRIDFCSLWRTPLFLLHNIFLRIMLELWSTFVGSRFYENEMKKDAQVNKKIDQLRKLLAQTSPTELELCSSEVSKFFCSVHWLNSCEYNRIKIFGCLNLWTFFS